MVNKIDGNNYYDYQKLKNVNIPDTGEKFSLDYKQDGLQSENKKNKDKSSESVDASQQSDDKNGVKLELSKQGQTAASAKRQSLNASPKNQTAFDLRAFIDSIKVFISDAIGSVKTFFYNIWNDSQPTEKMQEPLEETQNSSGNVQAATENPQAADAFEAKKETDFETSAQYVDAYRTYNEKRDREIQQYLRSGDLNQVMSLLTDNGRKTIARNSSLLTYYDKNGRMVGPSASDRERILHGDINARKL